MSGAVCLPASFPELFFLKSHFETEKIYSKEKKNEELRFLYFIELAISHLIFIFLGALYSMWDEWLAF